MPELDTSATSEAPPSGDGAAAGAPPQDGTPAWSALPTIRAPHKPSEVLARLESLSRRGKLAGFERTSPHSFETSIYGAPYDRVLRATIEPDAGEPEQAIIECAAHLPRRLPAIVALVLIVAVWPGVWLTHSMLVTYFGWYPRADWVTVVWYVPLTLLAVPVLWKQFRQSERSAFAHAHEVIARIAATCDGEVVQDG